MVVWVFSGGGESEYKALIYFLEKHFPKLTFIRQLPPRPGPRPKKRYRHPDYLPATKGTGAFGRTGGALLKQIRQYWKRALKAGESCDAILTFDDLDCRDPEEQLAHYEKVLEETLADSQKGCHQTIPRVIGFAAPELEAWFLADWDGSFGKHPDYRKDQVKILRSLNEVHPNITEAPESFSEYDSERDCCQEKLSELLQDKCGFYARYSKAEHTPVMMLTIDADKVARRCPIFYRMVRELRALEAGVTS